MVKYDKGAAQRGARYIRDRRSSTGGGRAGGGGGRRAAGGVAAGGGLIAIIVAIVTALMSGGGGSGGGFAIDSPAFDAGTVEQSGAPAPALDPDADTISYLAALMEDIQFTWAEYFDRAGLNYTETFLVTFSGQTDSGCGRASSSVGPFYCPAPNDRQVYIDLDFYDDLATRFGAPGDFAQAYVIAHEVGHHIQAITGISDAVRKAQAEDPGNANEYSVRQELQADCLAGVWAYSAKERGTNIVLEAGDIEEGLAAAQAVGDDRIQAQAGMQISPETWTHGSSAMRARWFTRGYETGDPEQCDTFAASEL